MVQTYLHTAGGGGVDEDPFIAVGGAIVSGTATARILVRRAIVLVQGSRAEIGWLDGGTNKMSLTNPRSLLVRKDY
jgi:hypothetical protein